MQAGGYYSAGRDRNFLKNPGQTAPDFSPVPKYFLVSLYFNQVRTSRDRAHFFKQNKQRPAFNSAMEPEECLLFDFSVRYCLLKTLARVRQNPYLQMTGTARKS